MSDSLADISGDTKENLDTKPKKGVSTLCSYGILFFLFMVVTSDTFSETVLSAIPGTVVGREVTTTGAIVSGIILILAHILIITYL